MRGRHKLLIETQPGMGRILDLQMNELHPPQSVDAIVGSGQWVDYQGTEDAAALIENAKPAADNPKGVRARRIPNGGRFLMPETADGMAELERRRRAGTLDPGLMHESTIRPDAEARNDNWLHEAGSDRVEETPQ